MFYIRYKKNLLINNRRRRSQLQLKNDSSAPRENNIFTFLVSTAVGGERAEGVEEVFCPGYVATLTQQAGQERGAYKATSISRIQTY